MNSLRNKHILLLSSVTVLLSTVLTSLWNLVYTHVYPYGGTLFAIIFFFCLGLVSILIINAKSKTASARQSINLFMGLKTGKILLSVFFVLIYALAIKIEVRKFIIVFVLLYLIYLVLDTLYLLGREKEAKKEKLLTKE